MSTVFAQNSGKYVRDGSKYYENGNHRLAVTYFERAIAEEPNHAQALYLAGISYMSFDKEKSADYIYRAYEIDPNVDVDVLFWLGRAEHVNYNFDKAIEYFKNYQKSLPKREKYQYELAEVHMQHARNAKYEIQNPKNIFVRNLGPSVNTIYSEHSPAISADDNYLVFTSRSKGVTGGKESGDGEFFEDIFETTRAGATDWKAPRSVAGSLNSPGHEASIQLFDNDKKMLLYRAENYGDIYIAERQADGKWGTPKSISDKVNSKYYESDAFITPDGKTLFFSTNQFTKGGNLDIYKVEKQANGEWGNPVSLGNVINTPFDEDSPFLAGDGALYFSSRGHNTMGGYDIFKSTFDQVTQQWTKPVNMGVPINSPDDDTYYRLSHDGRYAYLSSYRIGGYGEKDIYTVTFQNAALVAGKVFSKYDSTALAGVEVRFVGVSQDKQPLVYQKSIVEASQPYQLNVLSGYIYQVEIIKDNKVIAKQEVRVPQEKGRDVKFTNNFYVDYGAKPKEAAVIAAATKEPEKLLASTEPAKPVAIAIPITPVPELAIVEEEVLVQPAVMDLQKPLKTELKKKTIALATPKVKAKKVKILPTPSFTLEPEEPEAVIAAVVETPAAKVSEKTVEVVPDKPVVAAVVEKPIVEEKPAVPVVEKAVVEAKAVAVVDKPVAEKPVATEKAIAAVRPEVPANTTTIKETPAVGKEKAQPIIAKATEKPASVRRAPTPEPEPEEDKTVAFESIFYDVGSFSLRPASIETLDKIVKMMQDDKELKIKVEGYTMVEVVSNYSRNLSRNRAKSAYDYLVKKGISPSRLVLSTYNNKKTLAANTSEESMQLNRMTRFVIIPKESE